MANRVKEIFARPETWIAIERGCNMRKSEIFIGKTYSNGKGRERKIVDFGPQYKLYDGQESTENLRYEVVKDGSKANATVGTQGNMTLASFAAWAKTVVD